MSPTFPHWLTGGKVGPEASVLSHSGQVRLIRVLAE